MADTVFKLDPEIIIGRDTVNRAGALCGRRGKKIMLATERGLCEKKLVERLIKILEDAGIETILFDEINAHAGADEAENAASLARGARCDMVIGFGCLKTQHIARLVSVLAASPLGLFELLDGIREENAFLPYSAIPTEGADPFLFSDCLVAVDPRDKSVKLVKCPPGHCKAAILDPGLSEPLSGQLAFAAAFDGLCISLEAYCSTRANFLSDSLLEQAISLYAGIMHSHAENRAFDFPAAAANAGFFMSLGASASAPGIGTALAFALSSKFPVAKSLCSAALLPYVMEKLVAARPEKMAKAAALMGEIVEAASTADAANMAVEAVRRRMGQMSLPARLKDFNLSLDRMVPAAEAARSLEIVASSPWTVASEDAYDLLKQAF